MMEMRQKALKGLMDFLLAMPDEMPEEGGSVTVIEAEEIDEGGDEELAELKKKKKKLLEE